MVRRRRRNEAVTAIYLYDNDEASGSGGSGGSIPADGLSFNLAAFASATGTGGTPSEAPARSSRAAKPSALAHLSATEAAATKERLVKEQVYESFIKGGMTPADAAHLVATLPQCLIDQAEELDSNDDEESESDGLWPAALLGVEDSSATAAEARHGRAHPLA